MGNQRLDRNKMPEFYEYTPAINTDGDLEIDPETGDFKAGHPTAEAVKILLTTDAYSYAPDSTRGVRWPDKSRVNAGADLESSIRSQIAPYLRSKTITQLTITTDVRDNVILSETKFVDPKDQQKVSAKRRF